MQLEIPRPVAMLLMILVGAGILAAMKQQAPDLYRYLKLEAM